MKSQNSKRSRETKKEIRFAGLHRLNGHPSHIKARDWIGFVKRNPLRK